jgi:hypothetical protein
MIRNTVGHYRRFAGTFLGLSLLLGGLADHVGAQTDRNHELRQALEARYDVVSVRDGLVLRPKAASTGVRWIELSDSGSIAVDGTAMSGAELREKLGDDAPLILQLSYLDAAARRALFPDGPAAEPVERAEPEMRESRRTRGGRGVFRLGRSITVTAAERVEGDVVAVGGSVHVDGSVRGNAVAIAGSVELGPEASITGDVVAIGGRVQRAPTSRVDGELVEIGVGAIPWGGWSDQRLPGIWWGWWWGSAFALLSTLIRIGILCLLAAIVVLLARNQVERVSAAASAEPLKAGAIGILAQLLFVPLLVVTIVVLIVTIIGIPLLLLIPFVVLFLGLAALVGFTGVAYHVGRLVAPRVGWMGQGAYAATIAGILVLLSPVILARFVSLIGVPAIPMTFGLAAIGFLVEYLAWTIGFGAVALVRFAPWSERRSNGLTRRNEATETS